MTTLLALYRRPAGGDEALAGFLAAYRDRHLALVAQTPGLGSVSVRRVRRRLLGDDDLVLATTMEFPDWETAKAGLASEPMRAAGDVLAEIAPGLVTLLVLEDAPELQPGAAAPSGGEAGLPLAASEVDTGRPLGEA